MLTLGNSMQNNRPSVQVDRLVALAEAGAKPLGKEDARRVTALRKRWRDLVADELAVLTDLAELTADPKVLRSLVFALRRNGEMEAAAQVATALAVPLHPGRPPDERARLETIASEHLRDPAQVRERTQAELRTNAAAVQSNTELLTRLEELVAGRIGRAVRHVRSEVVARSRPVPGRSIVFRRSYTKHWFELSGAVDEALRCRVGKDGQLVVFVKSSSDLRVRSELEFILSEHRGQGLRTPYFYGQLSCGDLKVAAWEAVDLKKVYFWKYSFDDQKRVIEAVAALNALNATGAAPTLIKWINLPPGWLQSVSSAADAAADGHWKEFRDATIDVMKHYNKLAARVRSFGKSLLTHNDITLAASNIFVPKDGDVVIYDWEGSTLSAPGADLGLLAEIESGEPLMAIYIEKMREHGIALDIDRIRFTSQVVRGFRALQYGWRAMKADQTRLGLRLLTTNLSRL